MIRSMTGFGGASALEDGVHYHLELRSVNNKYFKVTMRLPEELVSLEAEMEAQLRRCVHRGSITLMVKVKLSDDYAASRINDAALLAYLGHLETVQNKVSGHSVHIDLTQLLALPGVLQPSEDGQALVQRARPVLKKLMQEASTRLIAMRSTEGNALTEDVLKQRDTIRSCLHQVSERSPEVIDEYHHRLRERIDQLMAQAKIKVDEVDLIREIAVFAERADISEELARMRGHLEQFEQVLSSSDSEPAGRTLDFISQELLRETNTIGSKSNDAYVSRSVVKMKSAIDRIKEQIQNVE